MQLGLLYRQADGLGALDLLDVLSRVALVCPHDRKYNGDNDYGEKGENRGLVT